MNVQGLVVEMQTFVNEITVGKSLFSEMSKQLQCLVMWITIFEEGPSILELNLKELLRYRERRLERLCLL